MESVGQLVISAFKLKLNVIEADSVVYATDAPFESFICPRGVLHGRAKADVTALTQLRILF